MKTKICWLILLMVVTLLNCKKKGTIERSEMPIAITNNAVCGINIGEQAFVYLFGGLTSGKTYKDITLKSFKYDVTQNVWQEIDPLPDTMGKIAAAASVLKGKIYIVGGYHVFADGHEKSSVKVHVYDPVSDHFLDDAADLPTPIDDHVQAVWRDSLIYVVSGWSDQNNVRTVQVFEPKNNVWHYGTSLPNEYSYAVFGSSGIIIEDQIYFAGGAGNRRNKNFPLQSHVRTGYINPQNALDINWQTIQHNDAKVYRTGVTIIDDKPAWIGGAGISYNYNGIAYTGPAVEPFDQAIIFNPKTNKISKLKTGMPKIMDLRGVAQFRGYFIIAGGMEENQKVSRRTTITYH